MSKEVQTAHIDEVEKVKDRVRVHQVPGQEQARRGRQHHDPLLGPGDKRAGAQPSVR